MKKYYLLLLLLAYTGLLFGQETASAYKFTSVVDLYEFPQTEATGGINVDLPLYHISTRGFELPVSLKYDMMGNSNAFYIGNQFGDAWVLNAAGTISRKVVQQGPYTRREEKMYINCGGPLSRFEVSVLYTKKGHASPDEYYYYTEPTEKYRNIPDEYTFSFMGLDGKFTVYNQDNKLYAEVYEASDFVKIEIIQPDWGGLIEGILIYDKNGYKYKFAAQSNISQNESYETYYAAQNINYSPDCGPEVNFNHSLIPPPKDVGIADGSNMGANIVYQVGQRISGGNIIPGYKFWNNLDLSEIYDPNGRLLISYEYEEAFVTIPDRENSMYNGLGLIKSYTKLYLKKINIIGQGTLNFDNIIHFDNKETLINSYTKSMEVKDLGGNIITKKTFGYDQIKKQGLVYFQPNKYIEANMLFYKRLLNEIKEYNNTLQSSLSTRLAYKDPNANIPGIAIIDAIGYLSTYVECAKSIQKEGYRADSHMLQKIKYPTGGSVIYQFEPNTYTAGAYLKTTFEPYNNEMYTYEPIVVTKTGTKEYQFTASEGEEIFLANRFDIYDLKLYKGTSLTASNLLIDKVKGGNNITVDLIKICEGAFSKITLPAAPNNVYTLVSINGGLNLSEILIYKKRSSSPLIDYAYAEGNRISKIAYYKEDVPKNILNTVTGEAEAEKLITFRYPRQYPVIPGSTTPSIIGSSGRISLNYVNMVDVSGRQVHYDLVEVDVRGVGKSFQKFDVPETYGKLLRTDLLWTNNVSTSDKSTSVEDRVYIYEELPTQAFLHWNTKKPYIKSSRVSSQVYENNWGPIQTITTSDYESTYRQLSKVKVEEPSLGRVSVSDMTYDLLNNKVLNTHTATMNGDLFMKEIKNSYDNRGNILKTELRTPEMSNYEKIGTENTMYLDGLLVGYTEASGTPVTLIYGYGGTKVVAKLINVASSSYYSFLLTNVVNKNNIQKYSDQLSSNYNEGLLKGALNELRTMFPAAQVSSYTYLPMIGISSITDANGREERYQYDSFNRLSRIINHEGLITKQYNYNFKN